MIYATELTCCRYSALACLAALLASATVHAEDTMPANDLRTLRVGASMADTDTDGLIDLTCADAPDTRLSAWSDYPKCPKNKLGLHARAATKLVQLASKYPCDIFVSRAGQAANCGSQGSRRRVSSSRHLFDCGRCEHVLPLNPGARF